MSSVEATAERLATLLLSGGDALSAPTRSDLVFVDDIVINPLAAGPPPPDTWAVDGGQALVADARCFQVYATRASRIRWRDGTSVHREEGPLRVHLFGAGGEADALAALGAPLADRSSVDVNLAREWGEWEQVSACVADCEPGGLVLVDGDLQPDWRLPPSWIAELLEVAVDRAVGLVGVTKHSSFTRGGAPLLGWLEREAEAALGPRTRWWAQVAATAPEVGPGLEVVVARLDPDARFAFRVDLPGGSDVAWVLGQLSTLADDAAFPGYPYPLSVADQVAACGTWVRAELWDRLESEFDRLGVPVEVRDRAFSDRHRFMERA
ncbi:MAG: DNA double-strand break repair nuclease NurA [Actinomycetota bacterium]|nr:DNA double-strand break repair nuclease NurA [Actinomycetota bacterium]